MDKICIGCNEKLDQCNFRSYTHKGRLVIKGKCKKCENERMKNYYARKNQDIKKQRKEFHKENPNNRKNQIEKLFKKRPTFKILRSISRRIRKSINDIKNWKSIIDFNEETLKEWLEYNFLIDWDLGMTLENHGTVWEIDHVKPISSFDLTKKNEQKLAFSWKNTVPRLCSDNKKKSNKIMHNEIKEINKRVHIFEMMKVLKCQKQPVNTINK
jgi:hypothetical protein